MQTKDNQEHIDRYLLGQMSPGEEKDFNRSLASSPELAEEVGLMQRIMKAISQRASRREQMERWDAAEPSQSRRHPRWLAWVSAAASVAVIIAIASVYTVSTGEMPVADDAKEVVAESVEGQNYRGLSKEVSTLEEQVEMLRSNARFTLSDIDSSINDKEIPEGLRTEEEQYMLLLRDREVYELEWLRIKALISAGNIREAREALLKYAGEEGYNREEALALLKQFEISKTK